MKKILIPLLMGMLCAPVIAEDIRGMMQDMGYTDPALYKHVPEQKFVPPPPKKTEVVTIDLETQISAPALKAEDFLQPRVYAKAESAQMIPYLLKLQKQNPTSAQLTRKLAVTCLKNGQPREALYWYLQTYQRDRSDLESLWNMAALAYQLGEAEQTQKYLEEYAAQDPNSAWGRMARDFLAGRFGGASMEKGFASEFSRFGNVEGGGKKTPGRASAKKGSERVHVKKDQTSDEGILVVEGKRTTVERFVESYEPEEAVEPVALKDTLKGKSGKPVKATEKKENRTLEKVANPVPGDGGKVDLNSLTTVAEPLSKTP